MMYGNMEMTWLDALYHLSTGAWQGRGRAGGGVEQAEGPQRDLVITVIVSDLCDDPADDCWNNARLQPASKGMVVQLSSLARVWLCWAMTSRNTAILPWYHIMVVM